MGGGGGSKRCVFEDDAAGVGVHGAAWTLTMPSGLCVCECPGDAATAYPVGNPVDGSYLLGAFKCTAP